MRPPLATSQTVTPPRCSTRGLTVHALATGQAYISPGRRGVDHGVAPGALARPGSTGALSGTSGPSFPGRRRTAAAVGEQAGAWSPGVIGQGVRKPGPAGRVRPSRTRCPRRPPRSRCHVLRSSEPAVDVVTGARSRGSSSIAPVSPCSTMRPAVPWGAKKNAHSGETLAASGPTRSSTSAQPDRR